MTSFALTGRKAGALQGWVLVATTWLSVIASAVIAPVLPSIGEHFSDQPHVSVLLSFVATLPALFVALLAAPFGVLADRVGHRKVLLAGVALYGFCGTAPYWLDSLNAIVITRAGVGIMEAMIMTCSNALLADYFWGDTRERWLAYETGTASVVAILMVALGGMLGQGGWRHPFLVYALGFALLPMVLMFTWEPKGEHVLSDVEALLQPDEVNFRWSKLLWICAVTVFGSTAFYVVIVQLGFLLTQRGITAPKLIGLAAAIAALATPLGSITFRLMRLPMAAKLAISFGLSAIGFFILGLSHSYLFTVIGAFINSWGSGIVLPALITWALASLSPNVRARGTGLWQSAMFLGQFVSPLIVLGLTKGLGSLSFAVDAYAGACSLACLTAIGFYLQGRKNPLIHYTPLGRSVGSATGNIDVRDR